VHPGQKFQTDDELKGTVLNWQSARINSFMRLESISWKDNLKKNIGVQGEYPEKERESLVDYFCKRINPRSAFNHACIMSNPTLMIPSNFVYILA
jgi:hypothetical protein